MDKSFGKNQNLIIQEKRKKLREINLNPEMQQKMWQAVLDYKKRLISSLGGKSIDLESERKLQNKGGMPTYGRSMTAIADMFNLSKEELLKELTGKKVLNIGPGTSTFADEAKKSTNCEIISIDSEKEALRGYYQPKDFIIGKAEKLPLADQTFDLVFSTVSMPYYASSKKQVQDFFNEVVRVLKIGGKANITPFTLIDIRVDNPDFRNNLIDIQIGIIEEIEKLLNKGQIKITLDNRPHMNKKGDPKEYLPVAITIERLK